METVIVHFGADACTGLTGGRPVRRLHTGDHLSFGRGAAHQDVGVVINHPQVSRFAGEIEAVDDYWLLSNRSNERTYVVENIEGGGEHVKVRPGRLRAPIPFELARVLLPISDGAVSFTVYAPQQAFVHHHDRGGEVTLSPFSLDAGSRYFQVLVGLCEPRLRGQCTAALPTVGQLAQRLAEPDGSGPTRAAIGHHIRYLADEKLRVRERTGADETQRLEWKREALVSLALRFDLVREEHLALLPPRHR